MSINPHPGVVPQWTIGDRLRKARSLTGLVSEPATYKPSKWAVTSGKEKNNVVVTITLVNGTGAKFDPSMVSVSGQSGDENAEQVYDSGKGIGSRPETKLLPGRQAKWKEAFNVKNPKDLVLEVSPDFDHDSVIYQLG